MQSKSLYLSAGLQSGGTTILSWCFLQRSDMDGVLDLPHDFLQPMPCIETPHGWGKATIACFRYQEIADYYRWQGWTVRPLLVIRDVRDAYASLSKKWYGVNGTTAEDPPLRLRLMRFLQDWQMFRENAWPIVRFESFVENPVSTLHAACSMMELDWDEGMLCWPKKRSAIADARSGNETFFSTLEQGNLLDAMVAPKGDASRPTIPEKELAWISEYFDEYNQLNGYKGDHCYAGESKSELEQPRFEGTRRDQLTNELNAARNKLEVALAARNRLERILHHPVLGRAVRCWGRFINPQFSDVWRSD